MSGSATHNVLLRMLVIFKNTQDVFYVLWKETFATMLQRLQTVCCTRVFNLPDQYRL